MGISVLLLLVTVWERAGEGPRKTHSGLHTPPPKHCGSLPGERAFLEQVKQSSTLTARPKSNIDCVLVYISRRKLL